MTSHLRTIRLSIEAVIGRWFGVRQHADADVVFVMPVFRDSDVARRSLKRLRQHYPGSRIVLVSDGDAAFPGDALSSEFSAEYVLGENLYGMDAGGRMVQRYLDIYLSAPGRFLVRLDTDARLDRRFRWLPRREGLYGKIGERSGTIQGGCILLTDGAVRTLNSRGVFLREELKDAAATWGKYSTAENLQRKIEQGRVAYDKVLHWGCVTAGVPIRRFSEIYAVWKWSQDFEDMARSRPGRFAIVHPDKMQGDA